MVLTGVWTGNDGGTYYIRQIANIVWWLGLSDDDGKLFTNVFRGIIQGDKIDGEWADVPKGTIINNGLLSLKIGINTGNNKSFLQKISATGGFSGSVWQKVI